MKKSELRKFIREAIKSVLKELDGGPPLVAPDGTIQGGPKKKDDEESVNETKAQDAALEAIQKISLNFKSSQQEFIRILRTLEGTPKLADQGHDKKLSKMFMDYAKLRDAEAKVINNMHKFVTGTKDFKYVDESLDEDSVEEKVVFYKDDKDRLRRFDTDKSANNKYRT